MMKIKESVYLKYWDVNNLYGWAMSQKLLVNNCKWAEDISKIDETFLEVGIQYPENLHKLHQFLSERMKTEKHEKLVAN